MMSKFLLDYDNLKKKIRILMRKPLGDLLLSESSLMESDKRRMVLKTEIRF